MSAGVAFLKGSDLGSIIYYNTYLLSQLLEKYTREGDDMKVEVVRNVSPIAWLYINLHGIYKFRNADLDIDWKSMFKILIRLVIYDNCFDVLPFCRYIDGYPSSQ